MSITSIKFLQRAAERKLNLPSDDESIENNKPEHQEKNKVRRLNYPKPKSRYGFSDYTEHDKLRFGSRSYKDDN